MKKRIVASAVMMAFLASILSNIICKFVAVQFDLHTNFWMQILSIMIVVVLSIPLANKFASSIVKPLSQNEEDEEYVELFHLKKALKDQSNQIMDTTNEVKEKERNLNFVVSNISEGLILLDRRGIIMTVNKSACKLLGAEEENIAGKHIFAANHSLSVQVAVNEAMGGKLSNCTVEMSGLIVEVTVNPVLVSNLIRGVVVMMRDVTEKIAAEKMRREFSANVSHELKTPLTSISGYAELIKEGMAKPEDVGWISTKIYDEAQRLISLTNDIIRISRLDEGGGVIPKEKVLLMSIIDEVADRLEDKAEASAVMISVRGEGGVVNGNVSLLYEMFYNLCENAIKYNKPSGKVDIFARTEGEHVIVTVTDTGVGIPPDDQDRVFERFYRVDKSHSKETGGTGLGLSIVKNGAMFHKAELSLQSRMGEGTSITLKFDTYKENEDMN